jgi:hypothetical protein
VGTLWAANDVQKVARRNREAMNVRLSRPFYDVNDSDVVTLAAKPVDGIMLTATSAPLYTVPAVAVAQLHSITLTNTSGAAVQAFVNLIPSGGAFGVANSIFNDVLAPGETFEINIPYFLAVGDLISGHAATDGVIAATFNLLEYTNQPTALTLKTLQGVALTTANVAHYTVPASGVRYAMLLAFTFCNTTISPHTVTYYKTPSGQASGQAKHLIGNPLVTGRESYWDEPNHILEPGDFLEGKATTGAVVAVRLTVLEVV